MLATREKDKITKKAFANLPYLKTEDIRNLNIIDLANFKYLIVPKEEIGAIKSKTKN